MYCITVNNEELLKEYGSIKSIIFKFDTVRIIMKNKCTNIARVFCSCLIST